MFSVGDYPFADSIWKWFGQLVASQKHPLNFSDKENKHNHALLCILGWHRPRSVLQCPDMLLHISSPPFLHNTAENLKHASSYQCSRFLRSPTLLQGQESIWLCIIAHSQSICSSVKVLFILQLQIACPSSAMMSMRLAVFWVSVPTANYSRDAFS